MSIHDLDITQSDANTGITFRNEVNAALKAIASLQSGVSDPAITYPYQIKIDESATPAVIYMRKSDNSVWTRSGVITAAGKWVLDGYLSTIASGTDTYTATLDPAITSYVIGAHYYLTFTNANTSASPTININALGAKTIKKEGGAALSLIDIPAGHSAILKYNGTDMILLNPAIPSKFLSTTASGTDTYTATLSPAITIYETNMHYFITFTNANISATPTINLNSLGAKTITKEGLTPLLPGDIPNSHAAILKYDGIRMILLNPAFAANTVTTNKIADANVNTAKLKTATASTSGSVTTDFHMHDYSFFPNVQAADPANLYYMAAYSTADTGNTVASMRMLQIGGAAGWTVRWRYMTASDRPTIWAMHNKIGDILSIWMGDDPLEVTNDDGVVVEHPGLTAVDPSHIVLKIPLEQLSEILATMVIPQAIIDEVDKLNGRITSKPYRIFCKMVKNPTVFLREKCVVKDGRLQHRTLG